MSRRYTQMNADKVKTKNNSKPQMDTDEHR